MSETSKPSPEPADARRPGDAPPGSAPLDSTFTAPPSTPAPTVIIGPYRILEKIGEGGMGEVYLADQTSPVRRQVALKLIKLGMDTKEVVARFESERQALALLNHPNIAHVFDAGVSAEGRPYFAMEFVKGVSIQDYCEAERLTVHERLGLFILACEGVQHAHQKGIIHRDLKPSNILVTMLGGKPVPKIIDFGVAKATEHRLSEATLHTQVGQLIGTPAYMSPEQAGLTLMDIDTRSDVYSLGAVLYELLTGRLPLNHVQWGRGSFEEVVRAIREVEPLRPSTRLSESGKDAAALARAFSVDPGTMAKALRGDLDWIVLKALEKDRTRRYGSVLELSADLHRHLNHEPVLASPPSTAYQIRKFVRRHRVGVIAAAAVSLALVAGIVGTGLSLVRALRAERTAREEVETAREVTDFMVDLFRVADPSETRANSVTAREVLDKGAQKIQHRLIEKPVVRTRLMDVIGTVYGNLGLPAVAEPMLREALRTREQLYGANSLEVAASLMSLADVLGAGEEGIALSRRALAIRLRKLGPDHFDTALSEYWLGDKLMWTNKSEEAKQHLERALTLFRKYPGKGDLPASWCLATLGNMLWYQGRRSEALTYHRESLHIKEAIIGHEDPELAVGLNNLGYCLTLLGQYSEAKPLLERAVALSEKVLGANHPDMCTSLQSYGELLRRMGEFAAARAVLERAWRVSEPVHGPSDGQVILAHQSLAALYVDLGDHAAAKSHFRRAVEGMELNAEARELPDWLEKYASILDSDGSIRAAARLGPNVPDGSRSSPKPKVLP